MNDHGYLFLRAVMYCGCPPAPIKRVAARERHRRVDDPLRFGRLALGARSRPSTLNWMPINREFALPVDDAFGDFDVRQLGKREELPVRCADRKLPDRVDVLPKLLLHPDHEIE